MCSLTGNGHVVRGHLDPRYQGAYSCILHKPCVYELEFINRIQKGTYLMKVS